MSYVCNVCVIVACNCELELKARFQGSIHRLTPSQSYLVIDVVEDYSMYTMGNSQQRVNGVQPFFRRTRRTLNGLKKMINENVSQRSPVYMYLLTAYRSCFLKDNQDELAFLKS